MVVEAVDVVPRVDAVDAVLVVVVAGTRLRGPSSRTHTMINARARVGPQAAARNVSESADVTRARSRTGCERGGRGRAGDDVDLCDRDRRIRRSEVRP